MSKPKKILADLKGHLKANFEAPIHDIVLFGSHSRHESNESSDYDILIILQDDYSSKDENQILDLCYDINLKYNILLDVHILTRDELDSLRGKQPIFVHALQSGMYA
jgi:predicted nucleotidyltransferase